MQKQWFSWGSAASMAFMLVILGGVIGYDFVPQASTLATPKLAPLKTAVLASAEVQEPALVDIYEQENTPSSERFEDKDHDEDKDHLEEDHDEDHPEESKED